MLLLSEKIRHLYNRAGFGPTLADFQKIQTLSQALENFFHVPTQIKHLPSPSKEIPSGRQFRNMSVEEQEAAKKMNRMNMMELNAAWIHHMVDTPDQLRERMTFFWHDHFACLLRNPRIAHIQNTTLRAYALDTYPNLLHAIAKDPGMLLFLNNQQNVKEHPNENFARELMELFTLGRGYYTEKDVQEAARAFTGWSVMPDGSFFFRAGKHDYGKKEFLGKRGNFDGEDIIDLLLEQRRTAEFITEKVYRHFVHHVPDQEMIKIWSKYFYESGYNISALLRMIFDSDHFYAGANRGNRIKSPVDYLVSIMRLLNIRFGSSEGPILIQKLLGQMLFFPPNVSGWPEQRAWIDSSSLITRLHLPKVIFQMGSLEVLPKEAFAGNEDILKFKKFRQKLDVQIDWSELEAYLDSIPPNEIGTRLSEYILSVPHLSQPPKFSSREDVLNYLILILSTPEFQLC